MSDSIPQKPCSKCGEMFDATPENFYRSKRGLYGLRSDCKKCHSINRGHQPKVDLCVPDGMKRCPECKQNYPATHEYFHRSSKHKSGLAPRCKTCAVLVAKIHYANNAETRRARIKQWQADNTDKVAASRKRTAPKQNERRREKHAANPEPKRESDRRYGKQHRDKIRARQIEWERENPHKKKAIGHRYRAKKRQLPYEWTDNDWIRCLEYWHDTCAFCGRPQGLFHKIVPEHWIPISDKRGNNPGTVSTNIIPACHGVDGCNNEKSNHDPVGFLTRKFGKQRAKEKLAEIMAYFEWVSQTT